MGRPTNLSLFLLAIVSSMPACNQVYNHIHKKVKLSLGVLLCLILIVDSPRWMWLDATQTWSQQKPPLSSALLTEKVINSPNTPTNCRTISTFNQHFGQSIMAYATNAHSIKFGDGSVNCGNVTGSFNTTVYKSDEHANIMYWLSPLEPNNRHQSVRIDRFGRVGEWLLETSEFLEWRWGDDRAGKAVLFCSGGPGVGKTYLR